VESCPQSFEAFLQSPVETSESVDDTSQDPLEGYCNDFATVLEFVSVAVDGFECCSENGDHCRPNRCLHISEKEDCDAWGE
jgi:hypothetical protein